MQTFVVEAKFTTQIARLQYGDDTVLHSEKHKNLLFYKGKLTQEHGYRTRSTHNIQFNPLKTKRRLLYLKTRFVPRSKHFSSQL